MEVSGQVHTSTALPQGKGSPYPLDRRLGVPRADLDAVAKRKNSFLAAARNRTLVIQPVA
jgi:hypothetical protein